MSNPFNIQKFQAFWKFGKSPITLHKTSQETRSKVGKMTSSRKYKTVCEYGYISGKAGFMRHVNACLICKQHKDFLVKEYAGI